MNSYIVISSCELSHQPKAKIENRRLLPTGCAVVAIQNACISIG